MNTMDEVRGILGASKRRTVGEGCPGPMPPTAPVDASERANELIRTGSLIASRFQQKIDALSSAFGTSSQVAKRAAANGGDPFEALNGPLTAMRELRDLASASIAQAEMVISSGRLSVASGIAPRYEGRIAAIDRALREASPQGFDTAVTDANDYSDELDAAFWDAEGYLNSLKQLEPGSKVYVGRRSFYVVNAPAKTAGDWFVTLAADEAPGYAAAPDGYTLLIPDSPEEDVPEATEARLRFGGKELPVRLYDVRLHEESEVPPYMHQYGTYEAGMEKIQPGDRIKLGGTTFRVIGKVGNAATVAPELGGSYRAARAWIGPTDGADLGGHKEPWDTSESGVATVLRFNPHTGQYQFPSGTKPGEYEMADKIQIVGRDPSLPTAVGEGVTVDRIDFIMDEAAGSTLIEKLVEASKSPKKVNGYYITPATAAVACRVYERLDGENRERLESLSVVEAIRAVHATVARVAHPR